MTSDDFDKVLQETIDKVQSVLGSKASEYARGDRLHNFKVAAALSATTPELALRGMLAKHIISTWDLIADVEKGTLNTLVLWDEKIIDSVNYLILLRALVIERFQKQIDAK